MPTARAHGRTRAAVGVAAVGADRCGLPATFSPMRSAAGLPGGGPGESGGEVPVGPLLGERARLAEDDRDAGPPDLQLGKPVGDDGGPDVLELEQLRARSGFSAISRSSIAQCSTNPLTKSRSSSSWR